MTATTTTIDRMRWLCDGLARGIVALVIAFGILALASTCSAQ